MLVNRSNGVSRELRPADGDADAIPLSAEYGVTKHLAPYRAMNYNARSGRS